MLSRTIARPLLRSAHRPAAVAASFSTVRTAAARFAGASPATAARLRPQRPFRWSAYVASSAAAPSSRRALSDHTREAIDRAVASAPVVLFMKGTPELPQCGFSRAAIQILGLQGVDPDKFSAFNVLEDAELRAGIKEYSDWPTIPQLYVDKEFVGGCDILIAMHQSGELAKLFDEKAVLIAPDAEAKEEEK